MEEKDHTEAIDRYLSGRMGDVEAEAFRKQSEADPELAEELAVQQAANALVFQAGTAEMREQLSNFESEWAANPGTYPAPGNRRRWLIWGAVAASLALVLGYVYWPTPDDSATLFAGNFIPYPAPSVSRNATTTAPQENAFQAYKTGDFAGAIQAFETLLEAERPADPSVKFYLGVAYLAHDPSRPAQAQEMLEQVIESDNDFRQQAWWYLALAQVKAGQLEAAQGSLNRLIALNGYQIQAAKTLLADLSGLQE